jgi:hypothetical protein
VEAGLFRSYVEAKLASVKDVVDEKDQSMTDSSAQGSGKETEILGELHYMPSCPLELRMQSQPHRLIMLNAYTNALSAIYNFV